MLILPGDPEFNHALLTVPPGWQQKAANHTFIVDYETGMIKQVPVTELSDYIYGGEYDLLMDDESMD